MQGNSPAISKPHGTCHAGSVVGVCILKCTADVNARAIAERRNGGMFHLIPLTRSTRKVCLAIGRACMSCVCVSIFYFIIRSASRAAYSDLKDMRSGAIGLSSFSLSLAAVGLSIASRASKIFPIWLRRGMFSSCLAASGCDEVFCWISCR